MRELLFCLAAILTLAGCGQAATPRAVPQPARQLPPAPREALGSDPAQLAARLTDVDRDLRRVVATWRERTTPRDVTLDALYQQRVVRRLARDRRLAARVLPRLAPRPRRFTRDAVIALRELRRLNGRPRRRRFHVGPARPAAELLADYRAAQRRFGVGWHVLAAVNLVESQFGRLRNDSVAGARGPMQFIPSTWRAFGLGGDVHDPRDAILGAANYLRHNGAPGSYRRAL